METPITRMIHHVYHEQTLEDLERSYYPEFSHIKKWMMFSDYSLAGTKQNDVITFSFLPHVGDLFELPKLIKLLAPKEIKQTRTPNPDFLNFLKGSPFLTFSIILKDYQYLFSKSYAKYKASLLLSLDNILETIPGWDEQNPENKAHSRQVEKTIHHIRRKIVADKQHRVLKNLFLITTIGGFLSTMVCNRVRAELIGWFSDRDEIHDVHQHFAVGLFNLQFIQYLYDRKACRLTASDACSTSKEWYGDLIKVPDYICGALADFDIDTNSTSNSKFDPILRELISDNARNIFVYKMQFFNGEKDPQCTRIKFNKV